MITGLDHVHVICGDVDGAVQFFKDIFGGRETSREIVRGFPMVRLDVKGANIFFMGTEAGAGQLIPGKGSRGLDHIGFKVKDFDLTMEELRQKGIKFTMGPLVSPTGLKYAFIEGPEGIRIELLERA